MAAFDLLKRVFTIHSRIKSVLKEENSESEIDLIILNYSLIIVFGFSQHECRNPRVHSPLKINTYVEYFMKGWNRTEVDPVLYINI